MRMERERERLAPHPAITKRTNQTSALAPSRAISTAPQRSTTEVLADLAAAVDATLAAHSGNGYQHAASALLPEARP